MKIVLLIFKKKLYTSIIWEYKKETRNSFPISLIASHKPDKVWKKSCFNKSVVAKKCSCGQMSCEEKSCGETSCLQPSLTKRVVRVQRDRRMCVFYSRAFATSTPRCQTESSTWRNTEIKPPFPSGFLKNKISGTIWLETN